ncbi:hypothetical protein C8T65DRAFT_581918, partial [Cerioporus squamosus]
WCHSLAHAEIEELLDGIRRRLEMLDIASPEIAVADNCCHVKAAIRKVFPDIDVVLDVWHFVMRYAACILNGTKNPHRAAVMHDITDAILKCKASDGNPAVYRSQEEQERRLVEAYTRWAKEENVWSAAAEKVHADQLAHVRKGCLARQRNDVRSDGSRIEGSHKGWNSLQRTHASGIVTLTYLGHDFVLRRNIRIDLNSGSPTAFVASTHGSHHIRLVGTIAAMWNQRLDAMRKNQRLSADLAPLPVLEPAASGETFGLMKMSTATATHYTFVKDEPSDELLDLTTHDNPASLLEDIGIDPNLAHLLPQAASSGTPSTSTESALAPVSAGSRQSPGPTVAAPRSRSSLSKFSTVGSSSPPAPTSPVQLPSSDVIELSSNDGDNDEDDGLPDITAVINSIQLVCDTLPGAPLFITQSSFCTILKMSSFFAPRGAPSSASTDVGYRPLCLPILKITGLTRSQQLLSVTTGLDPRSLRITAAEKDAFFLFMELRKKHQWASFNMTPRAWVVAASIYNSEVEKKNAAGGRSLQRKTPRALLEKLGEVEVNIMSRINRKDYKSRRSGGTTFWYEHCYAVPLRISNSGEGATEDRKVHTCTRCKMIMYPGGEGSAHNHKRGVCSDGVYSKARAVKRKVDGNVVKVHQEDPPAWPQPAGIFSNGTSFHAAAFLAAIEEMYERLVVKGDTDTERTMEYLALTAMLQSRLLFASGTQEHAPRVLFKLFAGLELRDCPKEIVVKHEGAQYIHINYLCRLPPGVPLVIEGGEDADAPAAGGSAFAR